MSKLLPIFFPFLRWLPRVTVRSLRADLVAGITGAIIVLPQGVAFATIAGLPPEYGLYAAMVPVLVAALFGSSFHLISGPTTAISLVVFANISKLATPFGPDYIQLVFTLTFLTGVCQLILGAARLGAVVNFVSHSVVVGFTAGAAVLIASSQLGHFFGLVLPKSASFLSTWVDLMHALPAINPYVAAVGGTTLVVAAAIKAWRPHAPALMAAMVVGSVLSVLLDGESHGMRLVGALPNHLPPLSLPDISLSAIHDLVPGAMAVAMLGLAEAVSIARAVAVRSNQTIDNSQEFIGQGLANIAGSFFSAYAASGSFTRTGVNYEAGAKTPLAAVFSSVFLALILLLVAPLTAYLPLASMTGVILLVAWHLIDFSSIRRIMNSDRSEAAVLILTFLATLFVQLEFAIYAGIILSLLLYLRRTSHPHFITLTIDPTENRRLVNIRNRPLQECPQFKILRLDGSIFFGAVNHISEELHNIIDVSPEQYHILIIGSGINFMDATGCHMLFHENRSLRLAGREISLCSLKREVLEMLKRGGCFANMGPEHVFSTKDEAIQAIVSGLDPERCSVCTARVFAECSERPGGDGNILNSGEKFDHDTGGAGYD
ncbi:MAG: SulP family inorganic anion transporter [Pseudomonadota bacterium]